MEAQQGDSRKDAKTQRSSRRRADAKVRVRRESGPGAPEDPAKWRWAKIWNGN